MAPTKAANVAAASAVEKDPHEAMKRRLLLAEKIRRKGNAPIPLEDEADLRRRLKQQPEAKGVEEEEVAVAAALDAS